MKNLIKMTLLCKPFIKLVPLSTKWIGGNFCVSLLFFVASFSWSGCEVNKKEPSTFSVTFEVDGGTPVPENQTVNTGDKVTQPATLTKTGFSFEGWYADAGLATTFDFTGAIVSDTTLYAKWTITHTIIYNSNGGSAVDTVFVVSGSTITQPANPTRTGHTFDGWYADAELATLFDFTGAIVSDTTLYVKWTIHTYTITYNSNGGSAVAPSNNINHGSTITQPADPTRTGYTFDGWYADAGFATPFDFTGKVVSDITLYAKWGITRTIIYNSNGGSSVNTVSVASGSTITQPANPTKTGFTFINWYADNTTFQNVFDFTGKVVSDTTLYAKWTIKTYTITYNSNGGSAVTPSNNINHGSTITKPVNNPTKPDSTFVNWYANAGLTTLFNFTGKVVSDTTLYAKWTNLPPDLFTLLTPADTEDSVSSPTFSWNSTTDPENGSITYDVYLGTTNSPANKVSTDQNQNDTSYTHTTRLLSDTVYYWKVVAKDIGGKTTESSVWSFTTLDCPALLTFNGKGYKTVPIGKQCWLAENLNDTSHTSGSSGCYDDDVNNCNDDGRLYDWAAAKDIANNISGWHLPSDAEWTVLSDKLGGKNVAGKKMKQGGDSGFNALLAGYRNSSSSFIYLGSDNFFWSSSPDGSKAWSRYMHSAQNELYRFNRSVTFWFSVRLLKD